MSEFSALEIVLPNETLTVAKWNTMLDKFDDWEADKGINGWTLPLKGNKTIKFGESFDRDYAPGGKQSYKYTTNHVLEINAELGSGAGPAPLKIATNHAWITIGARNNNWAHFETDSKGFYFGDNQDDSQNQKNGNGITVRSGKFRSYKGTPSKNSSLELMTYNHNVNDYLTRLTILENSGNVGIGTKTPTEKLEIYGGGNLLLRGSGNDPGDIIFRTNSEKQLGRIWASPHGVSKLHLSSGDDTADLTVNEDGNIGIGTTTPKAKLDIKGGPAWTQNGYSRALKLRNKNAVQFEVSSSLKYGIGAHDGPKGLYFFTSSTDDNSKKADYWMNVNEKGNIYLGSKGATDQISAKLHIGKNNETYPTLHDWVNNKHYPRAIHIEPDHLISFGTFGTGQNFGIGYSNMSSPVHGSGTQERFVIFSKEGPKILINGGGETHIAGGVRLKANLDFHGGQLWMNGGNIEMGGGEVKGTSDMRLKNNISDLEFSLEKFLQLRPVNFNFNGKLGYNSSELKAGLIAQEVQKLFPSLVDSPELKDYGNSQENDSFLRINFSSLIYYVIAAIKELDKKIEKSKTA